MSSRSANDIAKESHMPPHETPQRMARTEGDPAVISEPSLCGRPPADVALLAATALGYAYSPSTNDQLHTSRLMALAEPHPEALSRAETAVLSFEIGSGPARSRAAALLRRAARSFVADRSIEMATTGVPLTATMADQP
jgi:hypothetical protein